MIEPGDVQVQWNIRIPLRDGLSLSAMLYLPPHRQRSSPALFTMTAYVAQTHHHYAITFARHGFAFLIVDVRGRGSSEGQFDPRNEAGDGYDIVEWLAQQPYCNGKVAMWGGSYLGRCQWATASRHPPHLATIVPVASPFYGVDVPLRNNIFTPYTVRWLSILSGRTLQDRIFADHPFWTQKFQRCFEDGVRFSDIDRALGVPSALFQEWLAHPQQDAYWDAYEPTAEQYSRISIPILTVTGAYDGDQPGALEHYRRHLQSTPLSVRAKHYLIIGPWDHAGTGAPKDEFGGLKVGPASVIDLPKLYVEWHAWVMQDGPKPSFLRKNVAYYVTGAEVWRYADRLEDITEREQALYPASTDNPSDVFKSGSLSHEPPRDDRSDHYVYDPQDVSHAQLEATVDFDSLVSQHMTYLMSGRHLIYHSAPFPADTEIAGFFRLQVWLSIDQPDTDFRASVYEVGIDGSALLLSSDCMRARYRESLREARLVENTLPLRYDFRRFTFVARWIRAGSRLRLVFGPINSIQHQKNYNSGGVVAGESLRDARPVTVRLFHGTQFPSALFVPLGRREPDEQLDPLRAS